MLSRFYVYARRDARRKFAARTVAFDAAKCRELGERVIGDLDGWIMVAAGVGVEKAMSDREVRASYLRAVRHALPACPESDALLSAYGLSRRVFSENA